jgi:hypothetical protein
MLSYKISDDKCTSGAIDITIYKHLQNCESPKRCTYKSCDGCTNGHGCYYDEEKKKGVCDEDAKDGPLLLGQTDPETGISKKWTQLCGTTPSIYNITSLGMVIGEALTTETWKESDCKPFFNVYMKINCGEPGPTIFGYLMAIILPIMLVCGGIGFFIYRRRKKGKNVEVQPDKVNP